MTMKKILLITFALLCVASFAKDKAPRVWKTGTLFDTTSEKGSRLVGSYHASNGTAFGSLHQRRDDATYYAIESDDMVYIAKRTLTRRHDKQLNLTINAPVKFAIENEDVYLMAEDGKEHKLTLESKRLKDKEPAQK
jgi:hypothetical protein